MTKFLGHYIYKRKGRIIKVQPVFTEDQVPNEKLIIMNKIAAKNVMGYLLILILIILFWGEPDVFDCLLAILKKYAGL